MMMYKARDTREVTEAVSLIDDKSMIVRGEVQSGWDADLRGNLKPKEDLRGLVLCTDGRSEYGAVLKREIAPLHGGCAVFYHSFELKCGSGYAVRFFDDDADKREVVLDIAAAGTFFVVNGEKVPVVVERKLYCLTVELDIDRRKARVLFDDLCVCECKLRGRSISCVKIGIDPFCACTALPRCTYLDANFLVSDHPYMLSNGAMPDDWKLSCRANAVADRRPYTEGGTERGTFSTFALITSDEQPASLMRHFAKSAGRVCFEIKYLPKKAGERIVFTLLDGRNEVFSVSDDGTTLACASGTLRTHHANVWQYLRIEADTESDSALVKLNGKKCGVIDFEDKTKRLDGLRITFSAPSGGILKFVDVKVFLMPDEPADYVPAPVIPRGKEYKVGMNVCSLWRNGHHFGWDVISPYRENRTYLGYYDEGIPEVADWEIKWLAEHGLDFMLYCWYNNQVDAPIFNTNLRWALEDGHFNAKYGDMMKFAIIWEAQNCAHPTCEGFKNHVVPFWMDHFFSDDRYYTIDNKVVIALFGPGNLVKDFGSPEKAKEMLDYVRESVKELGYDGALFWSCGAPTEVTKACGIDAVYAYNWGVEGYDPDYTKSCINRQRKTGILPVIPTVSTGFNRIGWGSPRTPLMTCENMGEMLRWFKEDVLPTQTGDEYLKKTVILSTWNEYGEGTYMCPANLCGFGYLDEMRKAFTYGKEEHEDVRPNEAQLDRLGFLYPKGRSLIRREQYEGVGYEKLDPVFSLDMSAGNFEPVNLDRLFNSESGTLCGQGSVFDPQIIYRKPLNIDAEEICAVRIRCRAGSESGGPDNFTIHFATEFPADEVFTAKKLAMKIVRPDGLVDYDFDMKACPLWKGKVTGIRFDPTAGAGCFEIESVTFMQDNTTKRLYVDGILHDGIPPQVTENGVFIAFEQNKPYDALKFYHEWYRDTKTLYLVCRDKEMYFTVGEDHVLVNGKKAALPEKLRTFDGVPMLPLGVLCDICGFSYSENGRDININA